MQGLVGNTLNSCDTWFMAVNRAELHALVEELPDAQIAAVIEQMQNIIRPPRLVGATPFWENAGPANNGRTDNALRVYELLSGGFGR